MSQYRQFISIGTKFWSRFLRLFRGRDDPAVGAGMTIDERIPFFDAAFYCKAYADVPAADIDPLEHFLECGEREGRDPNGSFCTIFYRENYMRDQLPGASPLSHYIHQGKRRGYATLPHPFDPYEQSLYSEDQSFALEAQELRRHITLMTTRPHFIIFLGPSSTLRGDVEVCMMRQIYRDWSISTSVDDVLRQAVALAGLWFLVWLEPYDSLHPSALYCFASALNADPDTDVIYADEDISKPTGIRAKPFFKPDWSPDYLESCDYVGSGSCVAGDIAAKVLGASRSHYDFILRAVEHARLVKHLRKVLIHRRTARDEPRTALGVEADLVALQSRLVRSGRAARVEPRQPDQGCYVIKSQSYQAPLISIVIAVPPNNDGKTSHTLISRLLNLIDLSSFKNIEVILVGDKCADSIKTQSVVIVDTDATTLPQRLNVGAAAAKGDLLLMLNCDVEPLETNWIERLLEHFEKPHVGVVGGKLLDVDMRTFHVGLVLNRGNPDRIRIGYPRNDQGYVFSTCACRNVTAVTADVMLVRAPMFRSVGGFTECLNDVWFETDFCLRIRELGAFVVYAPHAELIMRRPSPAPAIDPLSKEFFYARWSSIATDPFYNEERLTLTPATHEVYYSTETE